MKIRVGRESIFWAGNKSACLCELLKQILVESVTNLAILFEKHDEISEIKELALHSKSANFYSKEHSNLRITNRLHFSQLISKYLRISEKLRICEDCHLHFPHRFTHTAQIMSPKLFVCRIIKLKCLYAIAHAILVGSTIRRNRIRRFIDLFGQSNRSLETKFPFLHYIDIFRNLLFLVDYITISKSHDFKGIHERKEGSFAYYLKSSY